jgi:hypothetical protein
LSAYLGRNQRPNQSRSNPWWYAPFACPYNTLKRSLKASVLPTSKFHGLSSTERFRHLDVKLRKHIMMYQAVISFLSNYPTGFRIVAGLFILFIPFLQLKGRDLRVRSFYSTFIQVFFRCTMHDRYYMFYNPINSIGKGNDADGMFDI